MSRALPEWIGKNDDSAIPPRVRLRIFDRYEGRCQCGCNRKIMAGEGWDCEDTKAIINGGERRENNLKPWLTEHHKVKTKADIAEKSRNYRKRAKHIGVFAPRAKIQSGGFRKSAPQNSASRPLRRKSETHANGEG